jgi:ribosome-binding factor A
VSDHSKRRLENHIQEVLTDLFARELRDPRVEDVVITAVELNDDYSVAKVFVMGGGDSALRGLRKAGGYLRGAVGRTLKMRAAPELRFREDRSLDRYNRLESLLDTDAPAADPPGAGPEAPAASGGEEDA